MQNIDLLKSLTILYVEDDEMVRDSISATLKRKVKVIYEAENGKEGLELTKKHNPDVILTDIEMPVMNGLKMIEEIRKEFGNRHPIVVITAYRDNEHFSDLADGYIYKPIKLKELFSKIVTLIEKSRGEE